MEGKLFRAEDKLEFKKQFAIQWLASMEAANYHRNCSNGWKDHRPLVEDAQCLADKAWEEWVETNGLIGEWN